MEIISKVPKSNSTQFLGEVISKINENLKDNLNENKNFKENLEEVFNKNKKPRRRF